MITFSNAVAVSSMTLPAMGRPNSSLVISAWLRACRRRKALQWQSRAGDNRIFHIISHENAHPPTTPEDARFFPLFRQQHSTKIPGSLMFQQERANCGNILLLLEIRIVAIIHRRRPINIHSD